MPGLLLCFVFAARSAGAFVRVRVTRADRLNDVAELMKSGNKLFRQLNAPFVVMQFPVISKFSFRYILVEIEFLLG